MHLKKDKGKCKSSPDDDANVKNTRIRIEPFGDGDDDVDDEYDYGPPITLEELNSRWNTYLGYFAKHGGYDVECFPPTCQFASFMPCPEIKLNRPKVELHDDEEEDKDIRLYNKVKALLDRYGDYYDDEEEEEDIWLYNKVKAQLDRYGAFDYEQEEEEEEENWLYKKVKEGAEMVISDINAKSTDGTYQLEDFDHVIWSTNFTTLMTLMTTKVVTGADTDADDQPVTKRIFQAAMSIPPVKAMEIISYRVKPGPGVEEEDDYFRYKNPRFYQN